MNVNEEDERLLFDLVSRMLEYEPSARIKVADAIAHPFFKGLQAPSHSQTDHIDQSMRKSSIS
jgi:serine/threonine protein kinase